ncbi:MAG: DUF7662 domain-containing protein [Thermomicrobiales bacterium]
MLERRTGPASRPSRYLPITEYLATQEANGVCLSLATIEELLRVPLPDSAYVDTGWWHNTRAAHVRRWTTRGWEARLQRRAHCVVFARSGVGVANPGSSNWTTSRAPQ